jgi:hypothetical protein
VAKRLTDAQLRNQRAQALRAVRRVQRTVDTQIEKMERKLDRAIENKERITIRLMEGLADDYRDFQRLAIELQNAIADSIQIFLS